MLKKEKLADLFLVFPARPKCDEKRFVRTSSLNVPEMRLLGTF